MLFAIGISAFGQTEAELFKKEQLIKDDLNPAELIKEFSTADFSKLWTKTENQYVYGFIGNNYQRMRIKLITVAKDQVSPNTYSVYGKVMIKSTIGEFHGSLKLSNIRKLKVTSQGITDCYKTKGVEGQYVMMGDYEFAEDKQENHLRIFKGSFKTDFYVDKKNKPRYDDMDEPSDSYTNNQFVGQWSLYNSTTITRCNWGDYRIPNSGNFDTGAGELSPAPKYLPYGWQSLQDAMESNNTAAKAVEEAKWWNRNDKKHVTDTARLTNLVRELYKWHDADFQTTDGSAADGFRPMKLNASAKLYSGIDLNKKQKVIKRLKRTGLFADDFLNNFRKIAMRMDKELRDGSSKWPAGESSPFMNDVDVWDACPNSPADDYWSIIKLTDVEINQDEASFNCTCNDGEDNYKAKAKKQGGKWRISYLEGFDMGTTYYTWEWVTQHKHLYGGFYGN